VFLHKKKDFYKAIKNRSIAFKDGGQKQSVLRHNSCSCKYNTIVLALALGVLNFTPFFPNPKNNHYAFTCG